jgi:tetratricopeptide (TPR) repeat protein
VPEVAPEAKKAEREHATASTPSVRQRKSDPPPSARRSVDEADALTSSGVSEDFFREDDSSLSPHGLGDDEVDEEPSAHLSLTPEQLDRRARLRRIVAGVVAFAGLLVLGVVVKAAFTDKASVVVAPDPPKAVEPTVESGPSVNAAGAPTAAKTDEPVDVAAALVAPAANEASAVAEAKAAEEAKAAADAKAAEEAKAAEAKAAEHAEAADAGGGAALDKAAIAALRKTTESLLNRGKRKEAITSARELIAADPGEAMGYLFLGSALQDSGKWKEGIEAYSECVRHATRGPVHECRAMGGRK